MYNKWEKLNKGDKMKKVYIVLTHTGTLLSRIIKGYTRYEFSHISISLDEELNEMYSFGRKNAYNPFVGGFVHEYIDKGTFKRFKKTMSKIYSLQVQDNEYKLMKECINKIQEDEKNYTFNIIGLFAAGLNLRITGPYSFYCAEFVKYVIESAGIDAGLPKIIKPESFKEMEGLREIYNGKLKDYRKEKLNIVEAIKNILIYTKKEGII